MITRDQAAEILKLVSAYGEARENAALANHGWTDEMLADAIEGCRTTHRNLNRYVQSLIPPETYDAGELRERVMAINATAGRRSFRWLTPVDPQQIRRTIEAIEAKPPEFWEDIARQLEAAGGSQGPWADFRADPPRAAEDAARRCFETPCDGTAALPCAACPNGTPPAEDRAVHCLCGVGDAMSEDQPHQEWCPYGQYPGENYTTDRERVESLRNDIPKGGLHASEQDRRARHHGGH